MKTVVVDTNIFIRYFIKDNQSQYEKSKKLFSQVEKGEVKGLVSILVINEMIWILENYYELEKKDYLPKIMSLLALKNFKIIEMKKNNLEKIFNLMKTKNIDFTDSYLLTSFFKENIFSFDKDLR
jgi:predicted nucleic acid-binding protein